MKTFIGGGVLFVFIGGYLTGAVLLTRWLTLLVYTTLYDHIVWRVVAAGMTGTLVVMALIVLGAFLAAAGCAMIEQAITDGRPRRRD